LQGDDRTRHRQAILIGELDVADQHLRRFGRPQSRRRKPHVRARGEFGSFAAGTLGEFAFLVRPFCPAWRRRFSLPLTNVHMTAFFRRKLKVFLPRIRAFLWRRVGGFRRGNLAGFQAKKSGGEDAGKLFGALIGAKLIDMAGEWIGGAHGLLLLRLASTFASAMVDYAQRPAYAEGFGVQASALPLVRRLAECDVCLHCICNRWEFDMTREGWAVLTSSLTRAPREKVPYCVFRFFLNNFRAACGFKRKP